MSDLAKVAKIAAETSTMGFFNYTLPKTAQGQRPVQGVTRDTMDLAGFDVPQMPGVQKPIDMPMATDDQRAAAKRRSVAEQLARRGRASTILTDDANAGQTLGA